MKWCISNIRYTHSHFRHKYIIIYHIYNTLIILFLQLKNARSDKIVIKSLHTKIDFKCEQLGQYFDLQQMTDLRFHISLVLV